MASDDINERLDRIEAMLRHIAWTLSKKRAYFRESDARKTAVIAAVDHHRSTGMTLRQACRAAGVSTTAYCKWRKGGHLRDKARLAAGQSQDGAAFVTGDPLLALDAEE